MSIFVHPWPGTWPSPDDNYASQTTVVSHDNFYYRHEWEREKASYNKPDDRQNTVMAVGKKKNREGNLTDDRRINLKTLELPHHTLLIVVTMQSTFNYYLQTCLMVNELEQIVNACHGTITSR